MLVSGCTTTAHMDRATLNSMRIDCAKKQEQIDFLRSQMPSPKDQLINGLMIRGTVGTMAAINDGTYLDRVDQDNGGLSNAIRLQIYNIQKQCVNY
jgi:hypothetical protein